MGVRGTPDSLLPRTHTATATPSSGGGAAAAATAAASSASSRRFKTLVLSMLATFGAPYGV